MIEQEKQDQFANPNLKQGGNPATAGARLTKDNKNIDDIEAGPIHGPLVILFGPRDIGKTVTLLRICDYLKDYDIKAEDSFVSADDGYKATIAAFEENRKNLRVAPLATGNINFLLLNVSYRGKLFCQILEAPGEHFFDADKPEAAYPIYFNNILSAGYRKVFLFFFATDMLRNNREKEQYCNKITELIKKRIKPKRDRVVIVCNKCDLEQYYEGGRPVVEQYKNHLYKNPAFGKIYEELSNGGFKRVHFVAFSAGDFNLLADGRKIFAPGAIEHPQNLWRVIHESIHGTPPWWRIW